MKRESDRLISMKLKFKFPLAVAHFMAMKMLFGT